MTEPEKPWRDQEPPEADRERLYLFAEECMEAAEMAMKVLRFGWEDRYPGDPEKRSNRARLEQEIGDVLVGIQLMLDAGDVDQTKLELAKQRKQRKLKTYLSRQ